MLTKNDIRIRDPFILKDEDSNCYFLYGTTDQNVWKGQGVGFDAYRSTDLEHWEGPSQVFRPTEDFWADQHFWAPEVYFYKNQYYMFASFKGEGVCRGTQILVSESPFGPFSPLTEYPITPKDWECLDGTLFIDEKNEPWIIFCREWLQVQDGEMWAQRLADDFKTVIGEPVLLFKASEADWTVPVRGEKEYITDGPYLFRAQNGELQMLWSSRSQHGYAVGVARSATGNILGPWIQDPEPLIDEDGGHAMLFRTFSGELKLAIHSPNRSPLERPVFLTVEEKNNNIVVRR
ncbi:glycoside hydrolase family 43 protein [Neobacillus sp. CF12]|uniref:glycoside hydrolase family 43 protein n=1 Tax=Neobacillus sp. CF12 TaxID=3055864 RepID=UPI0025A22931|nr:glycoside hydrolase family 43 protein [Neobacillus sp. CF12]MDM5327862.1 glycoside hydrolase family 43 protein [Neobacillus sp. CF12]